VKAAETLLNVVRILVSKAIAIAEEDIERRGLNGPRKQVANFESDIQMGSGESQSKRKET
jgi:hypothetical protein